MSVPLVLGLIALVLALIAEFQAEGKSVLGWAVVALACIYVIGAFD